MKPLQYTHKYKRQFTCSLMEQAEFGEERSSISDPLDPEDETLIWSAGTFLDPSLTVRRLKTEIQLELVSKKPKKTNFMIIMLFNIN